MYGLLLSITPIFIFPSRKFEGYIKTTPGEIMSHPSSFYGKKVKLKGYVSSVKIGNNLAELRVYDRKPVLGFFGGTPIRILFVIKSEEQKHKLISARGKWIIVFGVFREKLHRGEVIFVHRLLAERIVLFDKEPLELDLKPEPEEVLD